MIETKTVIDVFIRSKVSCSFETHYHTDLATFGVDKNEIESSIVEGASAPATSFLAMNLKPTCRCLVISPSVLKGCAPEILAEN